jgi:hypothetical protein
VSFSGGGKERAQFSEIKTERRDVTVNSVLAGFHQQKNGKKRRAILFPRKKMAYTAKLGVRVYSVWQVENEKMATSMIFPSFYVKIINGRGVAR